ncbi:probable G-protein coupled receptor 139 [Narcine bancroftii]|uniref:probable G-protein coupled receptor 139 n=1 Tax=Narcine bancroftii TaxID=1343680 RepID=UPI0038322797
MLWRAKKDISTIVVHISKPNKQPPVRPSPVEREYKCGNIGNSADHKYVHGSRIPEMHNPVTGPVFALYYPLFAAFAVPANLAAVMILSRGRCGLSRGISKYLVSMASSDLLVVITAVILNRIRGIYFPVSFLTLTPGCSVTAVLTYTARDSSVWLTVTFTFDRFVAICCKKLKNNYCNVKTAVVVICIVCVLSFVRNIPCYFMYEPLYIVNSLPWFCSIRSVFYTSTGWAAYEWLDRILTPCLPFLLILVLNVLTIRNILEANRVRSRLRAQTNGKNQRDPEMENRRKSIVLLLSISGSFLLFWITYVVNVFYVRFASGSYFSGSNFSDPRFVLQEGGYMLQLWSCCTNTCIYAGTQRKFREELKNAAKYPFDLLCRLLTKLPVWKKHPTFIQSDDRTYK